MFKKQNKNKKYLLPSFKNYIIILVFFLYKVD